MVFNGAVWITNNELPIRIVSAQRPAVFQVLFKNVRLVIYGDFDKFLQARRHGCPL